MSQIFRKMPQMYCEVLPKVFARKKREPQNSSRFSQIFSNMLPGCLHWGQIVSCGFAPR